jgi:hypothetical protein
MATVEDKPNLFQPGNSLAAGHGAPTDNRNAAKHYLRSHRKLSIGKLPKGCSWINTLVSTLRRELEALVMEYHGELTFQSQLVIQSSCRHEQAALLAQRWLRLSAETMSHAERLSYLQAIANESDKRDRAIAMLRLDRDPQTLLGELYSATTSPLEGVNE